MNSKVINVVVFFLFFGTIQAQVGIGTTTPNPSSLLDVTSSKAGVLIPRIGLQNTTDQTTIEKGNVNGLLIFNTTSNAELQPGFYYWFSNRWINLGEQKAETITTMVDNGNGTFTYINELNNPVTINLAAGPQGPKGDTGATGPQGIPGVAGADGAIGPQGIQGPKGDKGDTGATGPQGIPGVAGADGAIGSQGPQGIQGSAGQGGVTTAGTNVTVTGTGIVTDPYVINATGSTETNTTLTFNSSTKILTYTNENNDNPTLDLSALQQEPWKVNVTNVNASTNTENIYQAGRVGVNKTSIMDDVALDIEGAVRGGNTPITPIGTNSVGFGLGVKASGSRSAAFGLSTLAEGDNSFVANEGNQAKAQSSSAFGKSNIADDSNAFVLGETNKANGNNAFVQGNNNLSTSYSETVLGYYNAITQGAGDTGTNGTTGNITDAEGSDPLLQVGNGTSGGATGRRNALIILKNGKVGIGLDQTTLHKPSERLDIGVGKVRIREIVTTPGDASDKIVTVNSLGVLQTMPATAAIQLPSGDTSQRPASPTFGQIRYNTDLGRVEVYVNDLNNDGTLGDMGWSKL